MTYLFGRAHFVLFAALLLATGSSAPAATITWTNTDGGSWNVAANWEPNQVPGGGDAALITSSGTYTVALGSDVAIDSLTLGGSSGTQTLDDPSFNFTIANTGEISAKGILSLEGGVLDGGGGMLAVNGRINWQGGRIGPNGVLLVAPGGVLVVGANGSYNAMSGVLTNAGIIQVTGGNLVLMVYALYGGGVGRLVNLPGGVLDIQADATIGSYNDGSTTNIPAIINQGMLLKSGGANTSPINPLFYNSGRLDVQSGTVSLNGGGSGNGIFTAAAGTTLGFGNDYEVDSALSGAGTNLFTAGTFTLNGTLATSNSVLTGSALLGGANGIIASHLIWSGVNVAHCGIAATATLTLAANGVLAVIGDANGLYHDIYGVLTNAGTIQATGGILRLIVYAGAGGGIARLVNLTGALTDIQADATIDVYNDGSSGNLPVFINQGTVLKSGGTNTTLINPLFYNAGTLDVQSGTVSLNGGGSGNGTFTTETGTTLGFGNDYQVDSALSGAGTNLFTAGKFTLNGSLTTANSVLTGSARLGGTNGIIASHMTWNGVNAVHCGIDADGTLTLAPNGVLAMVADDNTPYHDIYGVLTNAGTIQVMSGILRLIVYAPAGGGVARLVNAPGGLLEIKADVIIDNYYDGSTPNLPTIMNQGTVLKSGGMNTTMVKPLFFNTGRLEVQSGTLSLNGGGSGNGIFTAEAGSTLGFGNDYQVDSALTGAGTNLFTAGRIALNGSLTTSNSLLTGSALLGGTNGIIASHMTWSGSAGGGGGIAANATLTLAPNGFMVAVVGDGGPYHDINGALTNAGTIQVMGGILRLIAYAPFGGGVALLVNLPVGLLNLQSDATIDAYSDGSTPNQPTVINQGTLLNSGATNTSLIKAVFYNAGTVDVQSGTVSLNGAYDLTGGRLNFGLNSLTNFGQLNLAGAATLTGTVSANLNNAYQPIGGDSFAVLTYGSETGMFTNAVLPFPNAWQTNFDAGVFSLLVLNARPTLLTSASQTVNELTLLSVTNQAADPDLPAQSLSFSLVSGLAGMNIGATNGIFTWTPAQTQSPATNTISVVVTDTGTPALSATNSFTVIVKEVNVAPVLSAIPAQNVNELTLLTVTNAASNFNIHSTNSGYGLINPPAGMSISASGVITWTPSQLQSPGTNTITTVVTNANPFDALNPHLTATNSFTVTVREVNVAPVLSVIPTQSVNELTLLTVPNTATNFSIHSTNSGYVLLNPPAGMSISAGGVITWTPSQLQSPGTNTIITVVTNINPFDAVNPHLSATNSFTVIVREVNVAPVLPVIPAQNVNELTLLTVTNAGTNFNLHSTNSGYALINPPAGMSISAGGVITWTPSQLQSPGTNTITTVVTNANPFDAVNPHLTATNSFTVVVREVNVAPVLPVIPTQSVNELTLLTVTNTAGNFNIHSTNSGYALVNPPAGMTISASGIITWTPSQTQSPGTNTVTTVVTNANPFDLLNPHLAATNSFTVIVFAPMLASIANFTVNVGQIVSFTATAKDNDNTRTLTFGLGAAPGGATINSAGGLFNWRPPLASAGSSNNISVHVTDSSVPSLSSTQAFYVIVNALTPISLSPISHSATQFVLQVSGPIGPDYILQGAKSLSTVANTNWVNLLTNTPAASPFSVTDTNVSAFSNRFYRVRLGF